MFLLKILFVLLLIAFILLLAYTIYNKITHPEKSFMDCIPFINDFSQTDAEDMLLKNTDSESKGKIINQGGIVIPSSSTETVSGPETKSTDLPPESPNVVVVDNIPSPTPTKVKSAKKPVAKAKKSRAKSKTSQKKGDNIKKVNGIGPVFERKLNSIGVNTFEHIAAWTDADVERIDEQLELSGRPQREEWVAKAKILAAEKNS